MTELQGVILGFLFVYYILTSLTIKNDLFLDNGQSGDENLLMVNTISIIVVLVCDALLHLFGVI